MIEWIMTNKFIFEVFVGLTILCIGWICKTLFTNHGKVQNEQEANSISIQGAGSKIISISGNNNIVSDSVSTPTINFTEEFRQEMERVLQLYTLFLETRIKNRNDSPSFLINEENIYTKQVLSHLEGKQIIELEKERYPGDKHQFQTLLTKPGFDFIKGRLNK